MAPAQKRSPAPRMMATSGKAARTASPVPSLDPSSTRKTERAKRPSRRCRRSEARQLSVSALRSWQARTAAMRSMAARNAPPLAHLDDDLAPLRRLIFEPVAEAPDGGLCPVLGVDLAQDRLDMRLHGRLGHVELARDELVGEAAREALQHLPLALGEIQHLALGGACRLRLAVAGGEEIGMHREDFLAHHDELQRVDEAARRDVLDEEPAQPGLQRLDRREPGDVAVEGDDAGVGRGLADRAQHRHRRIALAGDLGEDDVGPGTAFEIGQQVAHIAGLLLDDKLRVDQYFLYAFPNELLRIDQQQPDFPHGRLPVWCLDLLPGPRTERSFLRGMTGP